MVVQCAYVIVSRGLKGCSLFREAYKCYDDVMK